jgi:hypothetical protein
VLILVFFGFIMDLMVLILDCFMILNFVGSYQDGRSLRDFRFCAALQIAKKVARKNTQVMAK